MNESTVSRRAFLTGTIAAGAAAACTGRIVGAGQAQAKVPAEGSSVWDIEELTEPSETKSCDVVVLGAGGTGLCAACQAKQEGLDTVVLEKMGFTGGSFIGTEGLFGAQTKMTEEKAADNDRTVDECILDCLKYHHWVPDHELYESFFSQTSETIDWLEDLGVEFDHLDNCGGAFWNWHVYKRDMSQGPGVTFMASLAEAADSLGIPVELECAGKKLIMKDGKVAGVLAVKKDGTVVEYDAPVVIIATGGYASNEDFLFAVSENRHRTIMQQGGPGRDGDGIKMAHEAGADMAQGLGTIMWVAPVIDDATWTSLGYSASVQPVLWINQDCKRFINEDRWLSDFSAVGTALANQERTFTVFTQADLDYWEGTGPYGTVFSFCPVGTPMTGVKDYLDELGTVSKCETMEDLVAEAANRGLDADAFKSIIEE